ncbi:MAG: glycosyltransferase [Pseudomonadales bacterium]|jgi:GT2 family glycosyltransferase|nr:glycosyltransferase [Pseudomonadales bacterium]
MSQVTFLIPSFNGLSLIKKHLPSVLNEAENKDEVLIVEDSGSDDTCKDLIKKYDLRPVEINNDYKVWQANIKLDKKRTIKFTLVYNNENQRFARSCNVGAKLASNELIFLLNNDVSPQKGARATLAKHFIDPTIFAVGAREIEPKLDRESGKNQLWWQKGRFFHSGAPVTKSGDTAWVSGGSGMFCRRKWLKLGGFDDLFYPAYWEDIDFSFRARQKGYKVLFDKDALVHHNHETTNQTVFGQEKINQMSFDNGTRFSWKNSNFLQKLSFLFFAPYWYFKRQPLKLLWVVILILALFLRLYNLGVVPTGPTVDEAAIGYNGVAIAMQRRDEWLEFLPVSFRSFGDYKAPLAIYLVAAQSLIMPITLFTLRLPFAIASVFSILGVMKIVALLTKDNRYSTSIAAIAGLAMSFTPWSFHYGRLGFESGYALLLLVWGVYFVLSNLLSERNRRGQLWLKKWFSWQMIVGGLLLVLSLYAYHSSRVVVPVLLVVLAVFFAKTLLSRWKLLLTALVPAVALSVPLINDVLFGEGLTRASTSFLFGSDLTLVEKISNILNGLLGQFSPSFLWGGATHNLTQGDGKFGVLSLFVVVVCLFSIYGLVKNWYKNSNYKRAWFLGLLWILIGLLPAAITFDYIHSVRSFLALPGFMILFALGVVSWQILLEKNKRGEQTYGWHILIVMLLVFNFLAYFNHYRQQYFFANHPQGNYSVAFNAGLYEALQIAKQYSDEVNHILLSTDAHHPYIFVLFVHQFAPIAYQGGALSARYTFLDEINIGHLERSNYLIIDGNPTNFNGRYLSNVEWQRDIIGQDGSIRYRIYRTRVAE